MGSGSSSQAPKETQSAPVTARTTPNKPKRNRQFEEVQIAGGQVAGNSRPRQQARSQGASPHPHQTSSSSTKNTRGTDPGASGGTTDRSKQQATPRQGGASNGRKPQSQAKNSNMPSQQRSEVHNKIQSIKEEDVKAPGGAQGNKGVKGTADLSSSSQTGGRNQVNVSHGNRFQQNQLSQREAARVKFQTDRFDENTNPASGEAEGLKAARKGVDARKDPNKTGAASSGKTEIIGGTSVRTKGEGKSMKGQSDSKFGEEVVEDSKTVPRNASKKELNSEVNNAVLMNGDLDSEDTGLLDHDDLSYDKGLESDDSADFYEHGQEEQHNDLEHEGHIDDIYDDEVEQAVAAAVHSNEAKQRERNNKAETLSMVFFKADKNLE